MRYHLKTMLWDSYHPHYEQEKKRVGCPKLSGVHLLTQSERFRGSIVFVKFSLPFSPLGIFDLALWFKIDRRLHNSWFGSHS